jgi:hypothetical protein
MLSFDHRLLMQSLAGACLAGLARAITGVIPIWLGAKPSKNQRIYFANHASHGDFILLASCLDPEERARTRAVAGADYWRSNRIRRVTCCALYLSIEIGWSSHRTRWKSCWGRWMKDSH